jgi:hypothetical protein
MVRVAVAGGSSPTLGRSIVTAILATGKHEAIILSRKRPDATVRLKFPGFFVSQIWFNLITLINSFGDRVKFFLFPCEADVVLDLASTASFSFCLVSYRSCV